MAHFVESNDSLRDTLLVNSTPLLIRSLQGLFPHSYKDLTPLAGLIADPGVIAVRADAFTLFFRCSGVRPTSL